MGKVSIPVFDPLGILERATEDGPITLYDPVSAAIRDALRSIRSGQHGSPAEYPRMIIPEPYATVARRELRKQPTWKLQEVYQALKAGEATSIEIVERNRAYAISAIEEILWERGKLP